MKTNKFLVEMSFSPALHEWHQQGRYTVLDGQRYFYCDLGQGAALLMVHGFPTSSWDWHKVATELARDYRVIAPDMLGFGFSDKPTDSDYSVRAQALFHAALLAKLGITEVHILAYSSGASVVQQMLLNNLQAEPGDLKLTIASVTFLNCGLFAASNKPKLSQRLLLSPLGPLVAGFMSRTTLAKNLRAIFGPATQPEQTLINDYWALLMFNNGRSRLPQLIGYLHERRRYAARWQAALVKHPARKQLVIGLHDSISGRLIGQDYRATVPNPVICELPSIGHYPQLEAPEVVIQAVRQLAR